LFFTSFFHFAYNGSMENNYKKIHFLGIGGISQSAIAKILKSYGCFVSGSDKTQSEITNMLEKEGIPVCINGISTYIKDCDLVVVSSAIHEGDLELIMAKKLNKHILSRAEMLGIIAKKYKNVISVAGTHGKTTTTGMISQVFVDAGLNPTIHIGGLVACANGNVRVGGKEYFITEACEYVDSFLQLKSNTSVILNIQKDHLDYFKTFSNLKKSFKKFANKTKKNGLIIYNQEDNNITLKNSRKTIGYGFCNGVVKAQNIREYSKGKYKFDCFFLDYKLFTVKLNVYGKHNIFNALACVCVCLNYGIDKKIIKKSLESFNGIKRRFEDYGYINKVKIIHDYAHHPDEIRANIEVAKHITKGYLYVVFQPHTYSRTKQLLGEFIACFKGAKEVCVYKVYSARETPQDGIDEAYLARELSLNNQKAFSFISYEEMKSHLLNVMKEKDTLLILGAGDIESFASYLKS